MQPRRSLRLAEKAAKKKAEKLVQEMVASEKLAQEMAEKPPKDMNSLSEETEISQRLPLRERPYSVQISNPTNVFLGCPMEPWRNPEHKEKEMENNLAFSNAWLWLGYILAISVIIFLYKNI